jgi:hypothetical protein
LNRPISIVSVTRLVALLIFLATTSFAQTHAAPSAAVLPQGSLRQPYFYQLGVPRQGTPPWRFRSVRGSLPPGIELDPSGVLAGAPTAPGEFHFTLEATDSSPTPLAQSRDYVLTVPSPLTVAWTRPPQVTPQQVPPNGAITGEIQITNGTSDALDLTVIVVAVNTVNKAFALGYQRFSLGAGSQRIFFGSTLPRDTYVVHADAIAEDSETGKIYRARLQTSPLAVP